MATTRKTSGKARAAKSGGVAATKRTDAKAAEASKSFGKRTTIAHAATAARRTGSNEASLAGKAVKMAVAVGETALGAVVSVASLVRRSPRGKPSPSKN